MPDFTLTGERLRRIISGTAVGDIWPYADGTEAEIEGYLKRVVADLDRTPSLDAKADFDHYGSGYASYVHVFCSKSKGRSTTRRGTTDWIDGFSVYLCRLAPVAAYGPSQRTRHAQGGSADFLSPHTVGETPRGEWVEEERELAAVLARHGFTLPDRVELCAPLPFRAEIPTVLTDPPYQVFDALFYWED